MKGTVLKSNPNTMFGVAQFLSMWEEDAVRAIGERLMGDRDSYPGQYLSYLIKDGFISRDEVEQASLGWLHAKKFNERNGRSGLDEIIGIASNESFKMVIVWIADHFNDLEKVVIGRDWSYDQLVYVTARANPQGSLREKLLVLFDDRYWAESGLFKMLFIDSGRVTAKEREEYLERLCKKARRIKKATGDNEDVVKGITHMLHDHFGMTWKDTSQFGRIMAKTERWLAVHAIHCPFPLR